MAITLQNLICVSILVFLSSFYCAAHVIEFLRFMIDISFTLIRELATDIAEFGNLLYWLIIKI
jgi:hypothetical protein